MGFFLRFFENQAQQEPAQAGDRSTPNTYADVKCMAALQHSSTYSTPARGHRHTQAPNQNPIVSDHVSRDRISTDEMISSCRSVLAGRRVSFMIVLGDMQS